MAEESDIDITSNPLNLDGLVEDLENFPDRGQLQLILDSGMKQFVRPLGM